MARELKYHSPNTDLTALQRELAASGKSDVDVDDDPVVDPDDDSDDEDNDPSWAMRRS
ncbi:hypothetical protein F4553_004218 [Allocatelliglobosispora scoriae]|uniref:DUF3073 domain-containing protein n=1 Tax=Allocatelliglobosispora scoriae TaxID=643052 RepID=A0A841BUK5_9ACTN|nr:hypothetical protein [Allocatelliglobosispora scoriae]